MKKYFAILALAWLVVGIDARHGGGGGHRGGHRGGGHRWHGGGHRWHGGTWGRRWWGPGFGIGVGFPVYDRTYVPVPVPAYDASNDPYFRYKALFPGAEPVRDPEAYRQWLFDNYARPDAEYWWNYFLTYRR